MQFWLLLLPRVGLFKCSKKYCTDAFASFGLHHQSSCKPLPVIPGLTRDPLRYATAPSCTLNRCPAEACPSLYALQISRCVRNDRASVFDSWVVKKAKVKTKKWKSSVPRRFKIFAALCVLAPSRPKLISSISGSQKSKWQRRQSQGSACPASCRNLPGTRSMPQSARPAACRLSWQLQKV